VGVVTGGLVVQFFVVAFVNAAMEKTTLVGTFVHDHGVFHVVAGVRDDSDDCVGALGTETEVVLSMVFGSDHWGLWE